MSDETPIDLYRLDPGAPPDLVKGAMKRFRLHAVVFALVAILACASVAGVILYVGTHYDLTSESFAAARRLPRTEQAIRYGDAINCATPTYRVGGIDITLLQIAPLGGGWAMHVLVDGGDSPITVQRDFEGGSAPRSMSIASVEAGTPIPDAPTFLPYTRAGWTNAEMYVAVPAGLDDTFDMRLSGTRGENMGTFTIDLRELGLVSADGADC